MKTTLRLQLPDRELTPREFASLVTTLADIPSAGALVKTTVTVNVDTEKMSPEMGRATERMVERLKAMGAEELGAP